MWREDLSTARFLEKPWTLARRCRSKELLATVFFDKMLQFEKEFLSTTYVELF